MSHIHLDGVTIGVAGKSPLFPPLTQAVSHEIAGLFGRNGCGKSTLLATIARQRAPLQGTITIDGRIGMMQQGAFAPGVSIAGALGVQEGIEQLDRLEAGLALEQDFEEADWDLPSRLERVMIRFDLSSFALDHAAARLSGGEQVRVKLAALLLAEPDILLLDEPTNDLDDEGRALVADLLRRWEGPALVASHDRELLEEMDRIVELSPAGSLSVSGGWSAFKEQRDAARAQAKSAFEDAEQSARKARNLKQGRSERQARRSKQGRMTSARTGASKLEINAQKSRAERTSARTKALGEEQVSQASDALGEAAKLVERVVPVSIALPSSGLQSGHILVEACSICVDAGGRRLFGPSDFVVTGPERIALTGRNGSGKSSLVRVISGETQPASGTVQLDAARIAVLDQHLSLLENAEHALAAMKRHNPTLDDREAHAALASFGFRADWSARIVETLSGGEQVRLALACLFSGPVPPHMLILDEPTNHLDIYAIELLERALQEYDGAILCVSHDRVFRDALQLTRQLELPG